jgi:hypothetical protein
MAGTMSPSGVSVSCNIPFSNTTQLLFHFRRDDLDRSIAYNPGLTGLQVSINSGKIVLPNKPYNTDSVEFYESQLINNDLADPVNQPSQELVDSLLTPLVIRDETSGQNRRLSTPTDCTSCVVSVCTEASDLGPCFGGMSSFGANINVVLSGHALFPDKDNVLYYPDSDGTNVGTPNLLPPFLYELQDTFFTMDANGISYHYSNCEVPPGSETPETDAIRHRIFGSAQEYLRPQMTEYPYP